MVDGQDGRSHKPGQTHDGAESYQQAQDKQVQMVATPFLHKQNKNIHIKKLHLKLYSYKELFKINK